MKWRVEFSLVLRRQLRPLRQRGVENHRVRSGDEQPGGIALLVALNFAAGRIGRVLACNRTARSAARFSKRAIIQMQDEDRRVRRRRVDFLQRRHAPLGELELGPAADHTHPLRRRRARGLFLQHAQRVRQRRHAVPAQLHVVVEPAANRDAGASRSARESPSGRRDRSLRSWDRADAMISSSDPTATNRPSAHGNGLGERTALVECAMRPFSKIKSAWLSCCRPCWTSDQLETHPAIAASFRMSRP